MMKLHQDNSNPDTNIFWNTKPLPKEADLFSGEIDPLTTVRCPVCSFPLIAIMGRRGPRFSCGCKGFER
jgi:ssDNA-binding Zn-finger/Zn-ribbon topoisomerase 1